MTTIRPDGAGPVFQLAAVWHFLQSTTSIPETHIFHAVLTLPENEYQIEFAEHQHGDAAHTLDTRDHNLRAADLHIIAAAAVSVLAIIGLLMAKTFGWLWMDLVAGIIGARVIANWAYGLLRDTGTTLMDIRPDEALLKQVRTTLETQGDMVIDLHVWRLGPGHFGTVASVVSAHLQRAAGFYHAALRQIQGLSHLTVEVHQCSVLE